MGAILTVQEVAERMRCEHRSVRRAIRSGELEAALIGGKWLVREEAVDDWFRSRCASPNPFSQSQRRTPRAGQGDPTAPLASNDCRRWREGADERSQARQAVRDLRDRTLHVFATKDRPRARRRPDRAPGAGPCRVAHGMRPSAGWRAGHSAPVTRPMDTRGLGQLAPARLAPRRDRDRRHRRPTALPPPQLVRLAAPVGAPQPDLRS